MDALEREGLLRSPELPSNIDQNIIFQAAPDLFTSRVDGGGSHFNENGFFDKIVGAGLAIDPERFFLEEVGGPGSENLPGIERTKRQSKKIVGFGILTEADTVQIVVEDGRDFSLKILKYRAENFPYSGGDMRDLNTILIGANTDDKGGVGVMLLFNLIKP